MTREEVIRLLSEHRIELREMGVKSLAIFGSAARDELRQDSDMDLLADLDPPYTYGRYVRVKFF